MATLRPDPTFYPSPGMAMQAPAERLAYVTMLNVGTDGKHDAMGVVDLDPASTTYGQLVGQTDLPNGDNELHHFGWNACSACLCPQSAHPHMERRYLIVPGIASSRIHILDTKPDPRQPKLVKVIEAEEFTRKTGYVAPHTVHCGPDGIYGSALGSASGDGPGGISHGSRDVRAEGPVGNRSWAAAAGLRLLVAPRSRHDDHLRMGHPQHGERRRQPGVAAGRQVRPQAACLGSGQRPPPAAISISAPSSRWCSSCGPHTIRPRPTGFVGVVVSLKDLSASIWMWHREDGGKGKNGKWAVRKVIEIPAEPADAADLPPLLQGFKAVPPLVTDINLSLDDRFLYVSCWGTGEFLQYDVSDPVRAKEDGRLHLGGIVRLRRTRSSRRRRSTAARRWSRSAVTASASI